MARKSYNWLYWSDSEECVNGSYKYLHQLEGSDGSTELYAWGRFATEQSKLQKSSTWSSSLKLSIEQEGERSGRQLKNYATKSGPWRRKPSPRVNASIVGQPLNKMCLIGEQRATKHPAFVLLLFIGFLFIRHQEIQYHLEKLCIFLTLVPVRAGSHNWNDWKMNYLLFVQVVGDLHWNGSINENS